MKDEGTRLGHRNEFLPILTVLPYGGTVLPEECKPLLLSRIPVDHSQLIDTMIYLLVVIDRQNFARKVLFGQFLQLSSEAAFPHGSLPKSYICLSQAGKSVSCRLSIATISISTLYGGQAVNFGDSETPPTNFTFVL